MNSKNTQKKTKTKKKNDTKNTESIHIQLLYTT